MRLETMRPAREQEAAPGDRPAAVSIYRPFFLAGLVTVLTTGCLLGAVALLGISLGGSFAAPAWAPYVLAHANSQLYGWVGLFVVGFALQQHPPRAGRSRLFHRLALATLGLLLLGILLRFAAEPLAAGRSPAGRVLGLSSAGLQALAVLLFIATMGLTRQRVTDPVTGAPAGLPWQGRFVLVSLGWWMLAALAEPWHFAGSHGTGGAAFTAHWSVPYREAQFLGFVPMMIFGVALARFHTDLGWPVARKGLGLWGLLLWNGALLLRMAGWLWSQNQGAPAGRLLYGAGGVLLALAALVLVLSLRVFERAEQDLPSHRFLRAAFGWLLAAGGLMALEPLHLSLVGVPVSHAYTGALRHALTVGFISQTILGVSLYAVPRLCGRAPKGSALLLAAFWLLNLGNGLRVATELATDYTHASFLPMGVTGLVELAALLIWAHHVGGMLLSPEKSARRLEGLGALSLTAR